MIKEYLIYILLIDNRAIYQFKREHLILISSIIYLKYYKLFKGQIYIYLIKYLSNIQLNKDLSISYSSKCLVNKREQVLVLLRDTIKPIIVNIKAQSFTQLRDKEYQRGKRGAIKSNKTLIKVIKQVFFDNKELFNSYLIEQAIT